MMRGWIATGKAVGAVTLVLIAIGTPGCGGQPPLTVRERTQVGDRYLDWGMVYYNSWLRDGNGRYLELAQESTRNAVSSYFKLQLALGHAYPDFYIIDARRLRGCRFLREIATAAVRHRLDLDGDPGEGCLK
jgi:hypothetical protein